MGRLVALGGCVPFYLRTGKRLARRVSEVVITFREAPLPYFEGTAIGSLSPNQLVVRIQPDEGIDFSFAANEPGPEVHVRPVKMDFRYGESFMTEPAEAYERLLHDALLGDHILFIREDETERAWASWSHCWPRAATPVAMLPAAGAPPKPTG